MARSGRRSAVVGAVLFGLAAPALAQERRLPERRLPEKMNPGEALAQPALGFSRNIPGQMQGRGEQSLSAGRLPPAMLEALKARGLTVVAEPSYAGYVTGVVIDPKDGARLGGTSGFLGGRPLGY